MNLFYRKIIKDIKKTKCLNLQTSLFHITNDISDNEHLGIQTQSFVSF